MHGAQITCFGLVLQAFIATLGLLIMPVTALCQEEVASPYRRYKQQEMSSRYYEDYEVRPRKLRTAVEMTGVGRRFMGLRYDPAELTVRIRARLSDSHRGVKFYETKTCESCHPEKVHNHHTQRASITCRQCHGGEPIAGINHYFSLMNPSRRHSHVCAKCHEGANISYATYVIHDPEPESPKTLKSFASYYYAYWFMIILLVGTLAFFVPHAVMVGVRELFGEKKVPAAETEEVPTAPLPEIAKAEAEEEPEEPTVEVEQKDEERAAEEPDQKTEGTKDEH